MVCVKQQGRKINFYGVWENGQKSNYEVKIVTQLKKLPITLEGLLAVESV